MKNNKKILAIVLTAALSLGALTGCGKSPVNSESSSQDGPQNSTESSESATQNRMRSQSISGTITVRSLRKMKH